MKRTKAAYSCSFCGKAQEQVRRLVAGLGGVYICNECIMLCAEIITEEQEQALGVDLVLKANALAHRYPDDDEVRQVIDTFTQGRKRDTPALSQLARRRS
jgi:ATP-dependent Clp protease ATP-binding subunit ClpX